MRRLVFLRRLGFHLEYEDLTLRNQHLAERVAVGVRGATTGASIEARSLPRLPGVMGQCFVLDTASISVLGYEHNKEERVVKVWNQTNHLWKDSERVG